MMQLNNQINFEKNFALAGAALVLMPVPQPWPMVARTPSPPRSA